MAGIVAYVVGVGCVKILFTLEDRMTNIGDMRVMSGSFYI